MTPDPGGEDLYEDPYEICAFYFLELQRGPRVPSALMRSQQLVQKWTKIKIPMYNHTYEILTKKLNMKCAKALFF